MLRQVSFACGVLAVAMATTAFAAKLESGDSGPNFKAEGVDGKEYTLPKDKETKATVVCFTCNKCPIAVIYEDRFIKFAKSFEKKGVKFIAINVNRSEDLSAMKERAEEKGFPFPYAFDVSGDSARAYGATSTPHLFVLDKQQKVVYQGAFDDNNDAKEVKKHYVKDAIEAVLTGNKPEVSSTRARGCQIQPNRS